ncbi:MAG TPA: NAD(P)-dependent alcohol dehydrogenase [Burkholderiaceae bacterium]|nr:NAD(P)-dependent alcohol dehydrogenase [Burkholderiaceae bacterium]
MRALELSGSGFEHLRVAQRPAPAPGAGEVLLRMRAAAVGLRDYKMVTGAYASPAFSRAFIPGGEGVGEVIALGDGASEFALGDRVNPLYVQGWVDGAPSPQVMADTVLGSPHRDGTFADCLVVPQAALVKTPSHLSNAEAATLPYAGLTAWRAVAEIGGVGKGDVVVVQGTTGIGLHALQFARALEATVIVTSKSDEKLERARALGADHVINYAAMPEWSARVLEISAGLGAALVLDPGGTVTMAQSIRAVRPGGAICVFGALGSAELGVYLPYLLAHNVTVHGVLGGSRKSHEAMARFLARTRQRPVIEKVVSLGGAIDAIAAMPKSEQFGKVCIEF